MEKCHNLILVIVFCKSLNYGELQVAIWRDIARRRLVVAFRGTEQVGYISLFSVQLGYLASVQIVHTFIFSDTMEGLDN